VLGRVFLGAAEIVVVSERTRSLDRRCPDAAAATREEELRRSGDDRPTVAFERLGVAGLEPREAVDEARRVALERGGEVLDDVHLVDVAARDGLLDQFDCGRVALLVPGSVPCADTERPAFPRRLVPSTDAAGGQREWARLPRRGAPSATQRLREPVAEVEVGNESCCVPGEELRVAQVVVDPSEGAFCRMELQHGENATRSRS
jgi:hypothetical protein